MLNKNKIPASLTTLFQQLKQKEIGFSCLANSIGLNLQQLEIDHLALRVNTQHLAQQWKNAFSEVAQLLSQNQVNGRPIYLFKLKQALWFCQQAIQVIELPYPSDKTYPVEGWEHLEVVIPFFQNETICEWQQRLIQQFQLEQNPALLFKCSQPKVTNEQLANPTIAIRFNPSILEQEKFQQGVDLNLCIKLHPYSIEQVVKSEQPPANHNK